MPHLLLLEAVLLPMHRSERVPNLAEYFWLFLLPTIAYFMFLAAKLT